MNGVPNRDFYSDRACRSLVVSHFNDGTPLKLTIAGTSTVHTVEQAREIVAAISEQIGDEANRPSIGRSAFA